MKGFRSGLEDKVAEQLKSLGIPVLFEKHKLSYVKPMTRHRYTPDFVLPNGIVIETKGYFKGEDRKKHRLVKEQYPDLDLRFVFSRGATKISKTSKTTYAKWCNDQGFPFADGLIPLSWLQEPPTLKRVEAAKAALGWEPSASTMKRLQEEDDYADF